MKHYKDKECERQQQLIVNSNIFNGTTGGGRFMGKEGAHRLFVLTDGESNLYSPIRMESVGGEDRSLPVMSFLPKLPALTICFHSVMMRMPFSPYLTISVMNLLKYFRLRQTRILLSSPSRL